MCVQKCLFESLNMSHLKERNKTVEQMTVLNHEFYKITAMYAFEKHYMGLLFYSHINIGKTSCAK